MGTKRAKEHLRPVGRVIDHGLILMIVGITRLFFGKEVALRQYDRLKETAVR